VDECHQSLDATALRNIIESKHHGINIAGSNITESIRYGSNIGVQQLGKWRDRASSRATRHHIINESNHQCTKESTTDAYNDISSLQAPISPSTVTLYQHILSLHSQNAVVATLLLPRCCCHAVNGTGSTRCNSTRKKRPGWERRWDRRRDGGIMGDYLHPSQCL
jgi:hypothetical protein